MLRLYLPLLTAFLIGCTSIPPASKLTLMAEANPSKNNENNQINKFVCLNNRDNQINSKEILEKLTDEALSKNTGLDKSDRRKALNLITSGKFKSDLKDVVILVISTAPKTMQTIPESNTTLEEIPKELLGCLTTSCLNYKMLIDVANRVYNDPSAKLERQTFIALLDNQTFRLALIVYANSNGIDINNADLEFVKTQLQNDQIKIEELFDKGKERLKTKYKTDEVEARLECLK